MITLEENYEDLLTLIDKALITTSSRSLVPSSEFENLLLDMRSLITTSSSSN